MLTGAWLNKAVKQIVPETIRKVEPHRRVCDVLRVVTEDNILGCFRSMLLGLE